MNEEKKETHVDDFIDDYTKDAYARWFLFLKRLPAQLQGDFAIWIEPYKLYANYKEKRYQVTGASRLGDVWLAKNFNRDRGYDHRVDVDLLSDFSQFP